LRRSEAELKASADWAGALEGYDRQPPLRGVLAAPLIDRKGRSMGCVRLSDKDVGDFTDEDANVLMQLAQVAAIAIENARLVEELRQADRRKDEFLAMLAHELRNPLAPIRNAIQVMNLVDTNEPRVQKARGMIERQVEHLVRLVDDLLDVSRITRGSIKLQRHRVDLSDVLTRAIEGSRPLIDARRHELAVTQAPQPLPVDADPVRLAQVFWNLLNNAAKYTPERGKISVSTELSADGQEAIVRVRDTGMGIPHEMLPKIFELFTQVERTIDRSEGGLGIGLTLVRRLTEMHGGRVEATSAGLGEGSEFLVRLPLAVNDESASRADGSKAPAKPTPAVRRILVVDDNRDSADSLATLLRLFGHDVRTAYEGRQAITVAKAYMPSVMLLDLGIPGMSGYEIANTLRALPEFASTILVALTGFGTDEDRRQTQSAGFDDHLVKPTDLATLQALLASLPNPATT
jgi:signal transduction histidine kinase/CheY-like chemotaxis protein